MRWYLNIDGKNYGPYDEAQILQMIQAQQVNDDWIAQEGGEWISINSHPPFAQALAARGGGPQPQLAGGGQTGAQGDQGQQGGEAGSPWVDMDLSKTIPFHDAGPQLAAMQNLDASAQPAGYQPPQAQPAGYQPPQAQPAGYQPPQAQPAGYQPPDAQPAGHQLAPSQPAQEQAPAAQQGQAQPQPDLGQAQPQPEAPSDQPKPPSFGKAVVIAAVILAAIIGVGVLLQILIGPGF